MAKVSLELLHGGMTTSDACFSSLLPSLKEHRNVIMIEQQGHGHTADIDRLLTFEQMADDTAALLRLLSINKADIVGYSDGGNVGLGLAIRHPDLVRKLVVVSTNTNNDGLYPEIVKFFSHGTPDDVGDEMRKDYARVAPDPDGWPTLVAKVMKQADTFEGWSRQAIQAINTPVLVMIGDADIVRPEHAVELFRLLPHAQLAVLPATNHGQILERTDWLLSMIPEFLDAPGLLTE